MSNLKYTWLNNKYLSDDKANLFLKYIKKYESSMIPIKDFVLDSHSLSYLINLSSCLDCEKYQQANCCGGNSYSFPDELATRLKFRTPSILEVMPDKENKEEVHNKYGSITNGNTTSARGSKSKACFFSFLDTDNRHKCAIHKWCLEYSCVPSAWKPYPCSLFPVFGVTMTNGKKVIMSTGEGTQGFSMFFWSLNRRPCVNYENARRIVYEDTNNSKYLKTINKENFIKDDLIHRYHPAYIEQETVLRYFLGSDVYDEFVKMVE